jgi:tape measure domain-containing protein
MVEHEILAVFDASMRVSGASLAERYQGLRCFGQVLAAGIMQLDECRTLLELNPYLMTLVAKSLSTTPAGLRDASRVGIDAGAICAAIEANASYITANSDAVPFSREEWAQEGRAAIAHLIATIAGTLSGMLRG